MRVLSILIFLFISFSALGQDTENWFAELKAITNKADQLTFIKQRIVEDARESQLFIEKPTIILVHGRKGKIINLEGNNERVIRLLDLLTMDNFYKIFLYGEEEEIAINLLSSLQFLNYGFIIFENRSPKFKRLVKRALRE